MTRLQSIVQLRQILTQYRGRTTPFARMMYAQYRVLIHEECCRWREDMRRVFTTTQDF